MQLAFNIVLGGIFMDKNFNIELGKKLFVARKALNLTRQELGKRINLHETTIKRYEDGEIKSLGIDKLKDFAVCLGIEPAYLMGWQDGTIKTSNLFALSAKEQELIKKYRRLDDGGKNVVDSALDGQLHYLELKEKEKDKIVDLSS